MSDESRQCVICCVTLAVITLAGFVSRAWYCQEENRIISETTKAAMENGYEQRTVIGMNGVYWVKKDNAESK